MSNVAVILGAGNSTRMKSEISKLLLKIAGKTVIERSVNAFLEVSDVDEVIVTVREQDLESFSQILTDERVTFAIGGSTRQQSVKNALETVDSAEMLIIHDGARPLVQTQDIENVIIAAKEHKAAAVGVSVKDTIKVVDKDNMVVHTPDRSTLFAVQTPQVFDFELYKKSLEKAEKEHKDYTDDCQLAENNGVKVKMVIGDYSNIKITTPDDVLTAEAILKKREASVL